jgi:hypothetical protein
MTMAASDPAASAPQTAAQSPASQALVLGSAVADVTFPWAGAGLIAVLILLALAARWRAHARGHGVPAPWQRLLGGKWPSAGVAAPSMLFVCSSVRLDAHSHVHVVDWDGRRMLVATSAHASPVLLDRGTPSELPKEPG